MSHRVGNAARLNYTWRVMRGCVDHSVGACNAVVYN